jgi:hypothetical protein
LCHINSELRKDELEDAIALVLGHVRAKPFNGGGGGSTQRNSRLLDVEEPFIGRGCAVYRKEKSRLLEGAIDSDLRKDELEDAIALVLGHVCT